MPAIPGMEPPLEALCLAPFGMEEGSEAALPAQEFGLVVGEPIAPEVVTPEALQVRVQGLLDEPSP